SLAILQTLHVQAHAAGSSGNGTNSCIQVGCSHVRLFGLGDFFQLSTGYSANLVGVRTTRTTLHTSSFLQQNGSWRSLGNEGKAAITVYSDNGRNRQTWFHALSFGIEGFTEFHDVYAALTQRRANWGAWVGLTGSNLKLDISVDFLCHDSSPMGSNAFRLPCDYIRLKQTQKARVAVAREL